MNSIKLSDMPVRQYGTAAVVTGRAAQSGSFKGERLASVHVSQRHLSTLCGSKIRVLASQRDSSERPARNPVVASRLNQHELLLSGYWFGLRAGILRLSWIASTSGR
jgi:hypothetical protein